MELWDCEGLRSEIGYIRVLTLHCNVTLRFDPEMAKDGKFSLTHKHVNSLVNPLFKGLGKASSSVVLHTLVHPSFSLFSLSQILKKAIWKVTSKVWEHTSLETKDAVRLSLYPELTLNSPKLQHTLINCHVSCSPPSKSSYVFAQQCVS